MSAKPPVQDTAAWSGLRFFDGPELTFSRPGPAAPLRVSVAGDRTILEADVLRCFPLSDPQRYLEIRERDGKAVGILRGLEALPEEQRRLVTETLDARYLVPRIVKFAAVDVRALYTRIRVETDRGVREFRLTPSRESRDSVRYRGQGKFEIVAQDGCRYEIPDIERLDAHSRDLFERIR